MKSEKVIEIIDSADEDDDIARPAHAQHATETTGGNGIANNSNGQNSNSEAVSLGGKIDQTINSVHKSIPVVSCDSNQEREGHLTNSGKTHDDDSIGFIAGVAASNEIEMLNELEQIPFDIFDPNPEIGQSTRENGSREIATGVQFCKFFYEI